MLCQDEVRGEFAPACVNTSGKEQNRFVVCVDQATGKVRSDHLLLSGNGYITCLGSEGSELEGKAYEVTEVINTVALTMREKQADEFAKLQTQSGLIVAVVDFEHVPDNSFGRGFGLSSIPSIHGDDQNRGDMKLMMGGGAHEGAGISAYGRVQQGQATREDVQTHRMSGRYYVASTNVYVVTPMAVDKSKEIIPEEMAAVDPQQADNAIADKVLALMQYRAEEVVHALPQVTETANHYSYQEFLDRLTTICKPDKIAPERCSVFEKILLRMLGIDEIPVFSRFNCAERVPQYLQLQIGLSTPNIDDLVTTLNNAYQTSVAFAVGEWEVLLLLDPLVAKVLPDWQLQYQADIAADSRYRKQFQVTSGMIASISLGGIKQQFIAIGNMVKVDLTRNAETLIPVLLANAFGIQASEKSHYSVSEPTPREYAVLEFDFQFSYFSIDQLQELVANINEKFPDAAKIIDEKEMIIALDREVLKEKIVLMIEEFVTQLAIDEPEIIEAWRVKTGTLNYTTVNRLARLAEIDEQFQAQAPDSNLAKVLTQFYGALTSGIDEAGIKRFGVEIYKAWQQQKLSLQQRLQTESSDVVAIHEELADLSQAMRDVKKVLADYDAEFVGRDRQQQRLSERDVYDFLFAKFNINTDYHKAYLLSEVLLRTLGIDIDLADSRYNCYKSQWVYVIKLPKTVAEMTESLDQLPKDLKSQLSVLADTVSTCKLYIKDDFFKDGLLTCVTDYLRTHPDYVKQLQQRSFADLVLHQYQRDQIEEARAKLDDCAKPSAKLLVQSMASLLASVPEKNADEQQEVADGADTKKQPASPAELISQAHGIYQHWHDLKIECAEGNDAETVRKLKPAMHEVKEVLRKPNLGFR